MLPCFCGIRMREDEAMALFVAAFVAAAQISFAIASPTSTVPAFLWSSQLCELSDLVKSVHSQGGWSNLLLRSSDIAVDEPADSSLVDFLKRAFTRSNFLMAFPYVSLLEEKRMEILLVSGFTEVCGHNLEVGNIAVSESCSVESGAFQKLSGLLAVHDHLTSRMEKRTKKKTDLVVFCQGGPHHMKELDQQQSEGNIISDIISSVERSGIKYTALYISDPSRPRHHPSFREVERFLAENSAGNVSANSTSCDEVCQIKSSLLEGVLVGIVLLLILISGLCCMMGIDTPTRFEVPQES